MTNDTIPRVNWVDIIDKCKSVKSRVDREIERAAIETGVFLVTELPDLDSGKTKAEHLLSFFDLDQTEKTLIENRRSNPQGTHAYRGYSKQSVANLSKTVWDSEMYEIGPSSYTTTSDVAGIEELTEPNIWPKVEPFFGWKKAMESYYHRLNRVGFSILSAIARVANLPESVLSAKFKHGPSTLRLLNYQALEEIKFSKATDSNIREHPLIVGPPHTDACGLSLIWQNDTGLQIKSESQEWTDIPKLNDSVSVHFGESLQILTNNIFKQTIHQVVGGLHTRRSLCFFLEPSLHATLEHANIKRGQKKDTNIITYADLLLSRRKSVSNREP